jgi:hypothetical protein
MKVIAIILCIQLAIPISQAADTLQVKVIEGQEGVNRIKAQAAVQPVVEVSDEQGKPVAGAEVTFMLPVAGPGATFQGWLRSVVLQTGPDGRAAVTNLVPNNEEGRFRIKVNAVNGTARGSALITQTNTLNGPIDPKAVAMKRRRTKLYLIGGAAAAVVVGVVAARSGSGGSSPSSTPISISPGLITIGGPR